MTCTAACRGDTAAHRIDAPQAPCLFPPIYNGFPSFPCPPLCSNLLQHCLPRDCRELVPQHLSRLEFDSPGRGDASASPAPDFATKYRQAHPPTNELGIPLELLAHFLSCWFGLLSKLLYFQLSFPYIAAQADFFATNSCRLLLT